MCERSIALIRCKENGEYEVSEEAIKYLGEEIGDERLGVMTICGKYRTGKSYLVNKVML